MSKSNINELQFGILHLISISNSLPMCYQIHGIDLDYMKIHSFSNRTSSLQYHQTNRIAMKWKKW